jgi:hypothetical protein
MVDALVTRAEEGRNRRRYTSGRSLISFDPAVSEWRNPLLMRTLFCYGIGGELRELKHLSSARKRN